MSNDQTIPVYPSNSDITTIINVGPKGDKGDRGDQGTTFVQVADPGAVGGGSLWLRLNSDPNRSNVDNYGHGLYVRNTANTAWMRVAPVDYFDNGKMRGFVTIGNDGQVAIEGFNEDGTCKGTLVVGSNLWYWNNGVNLNFDQQGDLNLYANSIVTTYGVNHIKNSISGIQSTYDFPDTSGKLLNEDSTSHIVKTQANSIELYTGTDQLAYFGKGFFADGTGAYFENSSTNNGIEIHSPTWTTPGTQYNVTLPAANGTLALTSDIPAGSNQSLNTDSQPSFKNLTIIDGGESSSITTLGLAISADSGDNYTNFRKDKIRRNINSGGTFEIQLPTSAGTLALKSDIPSKGVANGVASLDSNAKVPVAQLPGTLLLYVGTWNASTNTPTLADNTGTSGNVYNVTTAGTSLGQTWMVGDWAIHNGTKWERSANADDIVSVNGKTGVVVLTAADVGAAATSHTHTKSQITDFPTLGTSSAKDIPATGNASTTQVVYGTDTRLTDARTPSSTLSHKSSHATGGSDALTYSDIGAAASSHTHTLSNLTQSSATTGQVATWNGTAWVASTPSPGGVTSVNGSTGAITNVVQSSNASVLQIVKMTSAEYAAVTTKVATTLYVIVG